MRKYISMVIAAALLCSAWGSVPALAASDEPLMVIRFNQHTVPYQRPLYNTISQALQVKPSAVFDIVSVAVMARSPADQARYDKIAAQNTKNVLATLYNMGLPQSRINLTTASDNVDASEVRIFVR